MTMGRRYGGDRESARALMLGYCRGERAAFDGLYARVAPSILAQLVGWSADQQQAEDLLNRTFKVLHACRSSYVEGADPCPWIVQIARREFALDCRRRASAARPPLWSRVRNAFKPAARVGMEARSQ